MNRRRRPARWSAASAALNADGSNLKASAPLAITPLFEATNISVDADVGRARQHRYVRARCSRLSQRFQVSDSDSFANILASGMGVTDASSVTRYTIDPALTANKRVRVACSRGARRRGRSVVERDGLHDRRCRADGAAAGRRRPRPVRVLRIQRPASACRCPTCALCSRNFSDASQSCPRGLKYVNNPWQDRVIDAFRQIDIALGLQRQADPHRRRQQRRAGRRGR